MSDGSENIYAPPAAAHSDFRPDEVAEEIGDVGDEISKVQPTGTVKAAAALFAATAAVLLMAGVQLFAIGVRIRGALAVMPWAMVGLGIGGFFVAVKIYRMRVWAVFAGTIGGGLISLAMALWFFVAGLSGLISALGLLAPVVGTVATVFSAMSIGAVTRAAGVRRRLAAQGLGVDF